MAKKILVIDDETDFVEMLKMRLEATGYEVFTASDGRDGLRKASEVMPDLILLDIMMPGMDGGDVAQKLRERPATSGIPVVFLTAAISEQEADARGGGGEVFIAKTADSQELIRRIEAQLVSE